MNSELSEAYYGVYCSSKEILKNNQRHLFCNMLDLLKNTCKTTGITCNKISNNEQVDFWISNILPLLFDEDVAIQASAVSALEQGLIALDINTMHNSSHWAGMKNAIITIYAPRINKLRDDKNRYWHQIWCLLIQVLDREILKGASTINSFLSIVELGFRSPDNKIRAEAFLCWRQLIKIFSVYDELSSPKRIKLICIPLKSSQSKSEHAAEVKMRVWWYLFSCLGHQIEHFFDSVVEPFLSFCFGFSSRSAMSAVKQYPLLRHLAFPCVSALFSTEQNSFINRLLKDNNLEQMAQPSPLTNNAIVTKYWQPIAFTFFECVRFLNNGDEIVTDSDQQLLNILIRLTIELSFRCNANEYVTYNCTELIKMLPDNTRPVISWFNIFAAEGDKINFATNDIDSYISSLNSILQLFCSAKSAIPPAILQRCIEHAFKLPEEGITSSKWATFSKLLNVVVSTSDEIDYEIFDTKLLVWRRLSLNLLKYLRENGLDYRMKNCSVILNHWIIWPLKICVSFAGRKSHISFDNSFSDIWRQLINSGQNSTDRSNFLSTLNIVLTELLSSHKDDLSFPEFFDTYVNAVLKFGIHKNSNIKKEFFNLFNESILNSLPPKSTEMCLNTFINMINELNNNDITILLEPIKILISNVVRISTKSGISPSYYENLKRVVLEKMKGHPNKNLFNEIKVILKGNDIFVIIPSVWSLNPEKLTDRQKERFAERADIPALYNDMSQSQESSIKPWTPKKIVIAKEDETEIILEKNDFNDQKVIETSVCTSDGNLEEWEMSSKKFGNLRRQTQITSSVSAEIKGYSLRRSRRSSIGDDNSSNFAENYEENENISKRTRRSILKNKPNYSVNKPDSNSSENVHELNENVVDNNLHVERNIPKSMSDIIADNMTSGSAENQGNRESSIINLMTELNLPDQSLNINLQDTINNIQKEVSPKKTNSTKFTPLLSPPDRKLTNNSSSPTLRPKPATHLTGRGAQLINMIRNKKLESSPYYLTSSLSKSNHFTKDDKKGENHISEQSDLNALVNNTSTPIQAKDLLIFSKRLPSPTASPSASILKRKFRRDSFEEMTTESPAFKRKRVSFHDPPVSVTKEYIKDVEENKAKLKRCLLPEKITSAQLSESRHTLKRRSKLDSIVEIEKFDADRSKQNSFQTKSEISNENDCDQPLHWHDNRNSVLEPNSVHEGDLQITESDNYDCALTTVVKNCSLEIVLDKYLSSDNLPPLKYVTILTKFLSNQMSTNIKVKEIVLEILSENHSKDFLDHAVQENLSSVVCDRLNLNSVIDFVCAKSKINTTCRSNLLSQVPEILMSARMNSEKLCFLKALMAGTTISDDNILNLISLLLKTRSSSEDVKTNCVSESAVDSSSNL